jgi:hypothetical protein
VRLVLLVSPGAPFVVSDTLRRALPQVARLGC